MTKSATDWIDGSAKTQMKRFYATLAEKDQRRFAALEAQRLGHGGIKYIAELLGSSTKTISRGINELNTLDNDPAAGRIRRPGAGRKKVSRQAPR